MKLDIRAVGEVELNSQEVKEACYEYVAGDAERLKMAISQYLAIHRGYVPRSVKLIKKKEGASVVAHVDSIVHDSVFTERVRVFKKKNMGFYKTLTIILDKNKLKRRKGISIEKIHLEMKKTFPNLHFKNFYIYISDKRQQLTRGYRFDPKAKAIY